MKTSSSPIEKQRGTFGKRARALLALGGAGLVIASLASGCSGEARGTCSVTNYPIPGDSYSERKNYCGTASECQSFCDSVAGRDDYSDCSYDATPADYCFDGDVPTAGDTPKVCALYQSIVCGGGSDDFKAVCDVSCTQAPNESDYDPSTDCLTKTKGPVVEGTSCDDALSKL